MSEQPVELSLVEIELVIKTLLHCATLNSYQALIEKINIEWLVECDPDLGITLVVKKQPLGFM
jgi:hypothetical protein